MLLKSRYYSYPVVVADGTYYEGSSYSTKITKENDGYNIIVKFEENLIDDMLNNMIKTGDAIFVHHIECPATCYREIHTSNDANSEVRINSKNVNNILQICTFVVANKNIEKYTNPSFSPNYRGFKFDIDKGCIMAVGNEADITINKNNDDLKKTSSIFSIIENHDETEDAFIVDLSLDKIVVKIPSESYALFDRVQNEKEKQPIMHSAVIVPALVYAFSEIKCSGDIESYKRRCRWCRNLEKACKSINFDLNDETLSNCDILRLSQKIINCPINKAVGYFNVIVGGDDND